MHSLEKLIIGFQWLAGLISIWFIPKEKFREASFIYLIAQVPAWILGLSVVEAGLIIYPARLFSEVNGTSFTFEFFILPMVSIFFNLYYPAQKNKLAKAFYYIRILSAFTFAEYLTEKYTEILTYIHWHWYFTWLSMGLVIYIVRATYKWFFKLGKPFSL
jgi:hypothetical protein